MSKMVQNGECYIMQIIKAMQMIAKYRLLENEWKQGLHGWCGSL